LKKVPLYKGLIERELRNQFMSDANRKAEKQRVKQKE
jgi:hypothetical protein